MLFGSNTIGDVMFLEADDEGFFGFWAAQGVLTQLDPYIRRDRFDLNVFFPAAVEALKIIDGKIWAFPYNAFMARVRPLLQRHPLPARAASRCPRTTGPTTTCAAPRSA